MLEVHPLDTPGLGDRSYLVRAGGGAVVVDPQRDIDRVLALAGGLGVRITHVFETHIHNDYLTGGYALAQVTGARYFVSADDAVSFDREAVRDGEVVEVTPEVRVRVIATPGHTYTHLSYAMEDNGQPVAVFTGGSLLYGSVGRPDLLGPDATDALVHAQYASAHRLAGQLPDGVAVYPTHGFGSFCSATQSEGLSSTLGAEKTRNPVLLAEEDEWVANLLAGLDAWPAYYAHMAPGNATGPSAPDLSPPQLVDPAELRRHLDAGEWVVDLRTRTAWAAGHLPGSLNFGLDGSFVTYLGWLVPWGTPVTLLGESPDQVAEAQRELVRIGIDRPAGAAIGTPEEWTGAALARVPTATLDDLAQARHHDDVVVLDVRLALEFADGHLPGAVHIPLHELLHRIAEVPGGRDTPVWVHCATGYRAAIAAGLLAAAGRHPVLVDDEFTNADAAGLPLRAA